MKHLALMAGAALGLSSSTAAADVAVEVDFPAIVSNTGPEAAAVWANAPAGNPLLSSTSSAAASADLTAGTMRGFVDLWSQSPLPSNGVALLETNAEITDTVTFQGSPGQIDVALVLVVDGQFSESSPLPTGTYANNSVGFQVSLIGDGGAYYVQTKAAITRAIFDAGSPYVTIQPTPDGTKIVAVLNDDGTLKGPPYNATISVGLRVPVGAQVPIDASLYITATTRTPGITETADFGGTARLSLVYPAGYSFTSESGVFLSRPDAGGLSLDGGMGGPPDLGTGSTTGGSASAGSTSTGGAGNGGSATGGSANGGSVNGGSVNGGSGSGGSGGVNSSSGSTSSGGTPKPSSGCSSVGADDASASGFLLGRSSLGR